MAHFLTSWPSCSPLFPVLQQGQPQEHLPCSYLGIFVCSAFFSRNTISPDNLLGLFLHFVQVYAQVSPPREPFPRSSGRTHSLLWKLSRFIFLFDASHSLAFCDIIASLCVYRPSIHTIHIVGAPEGVRLFHSHFHPQRVHSDPYWALGLYCRCYLLPFPLCRSEPRVG